MRVNTRNVLVISAVVLAIGVAFIISSQYFLIAGIQEIETEEITGDLITAQHAIDRQGEELGILASDYAGWDDTYFFVSDMNQAYIESNLVPETFSGIGIEAILYFDTAGNLIYADSYDSETGEILPVSTQLTDALQSLPVISSPSSAEDELSGILNTPGDIWIIAAQPIRTSDRQSPSRGHLVMVFPFSSDTVAEIAENTNLDVRTKSLPKGDELQPPITVADSTSDAGVQLFSSKEEISASTVVHDITGRPSLVLTVTSPRDTYLLGQKAVLNSAILFIIVLLIGSVFVHRYLGRHLTRRIENISRGVRRVSKSAIYNARLIDGGNDELTAIVRSVNSLLDTIQTSLLEIEGAGKALEESERKYRHLFEAANEAIFILDGEIICECNQAAEEMTGCGRNDLTGKRMDEILGTCLYDPDGSVLAEHTEAAYAGESRHFTCERHLNSQPSRHFSLSLSRFTGTERVYLLAIVREITAFVKNKEHLRVTQFSVDNADDAIYWVKKDGSVTYGNTAASRSLGYTHEELTTLKVWDINPTIAPDTWPSVWSRIADGSRVHEESMLKRSDNTAFPIAQTNSFLSTRGEEFTCIFARDITETVEMREREKEALSRIEENLLSLAILNDHIRNPLTIISATADLHEDQSREIILSQVDEIDKIVRKLDQGWLESAKIREFMVKHYDFEQDKDRET